MQNSLLSSAWGGPLSVLKDLNSGGKLSEAASPGSESSSSDEGFEMSIRRQKGAEVQTIVPDLLQIWFLSIYLVDVSPRMSIPVKKGVACRMQKHGLCE
jgi:hypothetical protein